MSRVTWLLVVLCVGVAACTTSNASEIPPTTAPVAPVTTLPPPSATEPDAPIPETSSTTTVTLPDNECEVSTERDGEGTIQGCRVLGLTISTSANVDPVAIEQHADRVYHLLVGRPDLVEALNEAAIEGRTIPADEPITDLPEFADLYEQYPGTDWDRRGRSFPGTEIVPFFSAPEENLLCLDDDRNRGEDETVRSFALTIRRFGLDVVDEGTSRAIDQAYARAIAAGLWQNTLAEINADEYWAEATQSYFDANLENLDEEREPNSSHNEINTRQELRTYDPALWAIAESVYGDTEWRPSCP